MTSLFGGAISLEIPSSFIDVRYLIKYVYVSNIRQVPDNQEVFVDMASDASVIVEILEMDDDVADKDIALYILFADIVIITNNCGNATTPLIRLLSLVSSLPQILMDYYRITNHIYL
jgi:hypothetical protein